MTNASTVSNKRCPKIQLIVENSLSIKTHTDRRIFKPPYDQKCAENMNLMVLNRKINQNLNKI